MSEINGPRKRDAVSGTQFLAEAGGDKRAVTTKEPQRGELQREDRNSGYWPGLSVVPSSCPEELLD